MYPPCGGRCWAMPDELQGRAWAPSDDVAIQHARIVLLNKRPKQEAGRETTRGTRRENWRPRGKGDGTGVLVLMLMCWRAACAVWCAAAACNTLAANPGLRQGCGAQATFRQQRQRQMRVATRWTGQSGGVEQGSGGEGRHDERCCRLGELALLHDNPRCPYAAEARQQGRRLDVRAAASVTVCAWRRQGSNT